jgi:hypothetical protein
MLFVSGVVHRRITLPTPAAHTRTGCCTVGSLRCAGKNVNHYQRDHGFCLGPRNYGVIVTQMPWFLTIAVKMPSRDSVTRFEVSGFFIDYLPLQAPDFKYRISSRILTKILTTQGAPPVSMTLVANGKNFLIEGLKDDS